MSPFKQLPGLEEDELRALINAARAELRSRNPRRPISNRTKQLLDELSRFPPRKVAERHGVSRQYCYQLCRKYRIVIVTG